MNLPYHSRRDFLTRNALGIGGVALSWMLSHQQTRASDKPHIPRKGHSFDLLARASHHAPQAKAMISLFMHGGPSHIDLLDPKPALSKRSGKEFDGDIAYSSINRASKKLFGTPWKFQKHGESGTEISELLPHISGIADDICVVRSMHTNINGHEPSIWFMNTGKSQPGRPALGSWLTYGLEAESDNLPAYVVLSDPGGHPVDGVRNWSNGWLPSLFQGTVIRPQDPRILNLAPPAELQGTVQKNYLNYLQQLIRETILYPSLGTLPYTIIVFSAEEVEENHAFQEEVAFYLAFYFWDEYNEEDLIDFYKNTKEALQLEGLQKALYVEKIILQLQNPEEYEFWLSKQIASAIGMLSGKLQPYFQLKMN